MAGVFGVIARWMDAAPEPPASPLILLVEDDASVRAALTFALSIEGYSMQVFEDAEALLHLSNLPAPACLVLDQQLPGRSGVEALTVLRERGLAAPAILITTQPGTGVRIAAQRLGARLVEKPLLGGVLSAALREILGR